MSRLDIDQTIASLSNDKVPSLVEMSYIWFCFFMSNDLAEGIVKLQGMEWLSERVERKLQLWIPYALKCLENEWTHAIEGQVAPILEAREQIQSIGDIISLHSLAQVRYDAHVRAGREAVEYLKSGKAQMRSVYLSVLYAALLVGVKPFQLGSPSLDLQREARGRSKGDEVAIKRTVRLNELLNPALNE